MSDPSHETEPGAARATGALDLTGKVAVITGATLRRNGVGIGGATARLMARRGADVIVADVDFDGASALAEELQGGGHTALAVALDLGDEHSVQGLFDTAGQQFGRVDILHNNATAVFADDTTLDEIETTTWDRTFAVNARGFMLASKFALRAMPPSGGSIINTSSNSSLLGDISRIAYGASKAAINTLTLYVATQYGARGVRCNAVCPGLTLSATTRSAVPPDALAAYQRHTLTPYLGTPEHLAEVVAFLASDAAAFITGQIISVDGGLFSHQPQTADFENIATATFAPVAPREPIPQASS